VEQSCANFRWIRSATEAAESLSQLLEGKVVADKLLRPGAQAVEINGRAEFRLGRFAKTRRKKIANEPVGSGSLVAARFCNKEPKQEREVADE